MMRYNALYCGYGGSNLQWVRDASSQLQTDSWDPCTPLIFDGSLWNDPVREEAAVSLLKALQVNTSTRSTTFQNSYMGREASAALAETFESNASVQSITMKNLIEERTDLPINLPSTLFKNSLLREVTLERCYLDESACAELATLLRSKDCHLRSLDLKSVAFYEPGVDNVSSAIAENRSLRYVTMTNLRQLSAESLQHLLIAFSKNTSIQLLELEQMDLHLEHAPDIARLLSRSHSLEFLSLRGSSLNADALDVIMENGLRSNVTLKSLDLSENNIGDDGVRSIVCCMRRNATLQKLFLSNCAIGLKGCKEFAVGVASFSGLKHLRMDMNKMELCGPEMLKSLSNNTIIQSVMSCHPSISFRQEGKMREAAIWDQIEVYFRLNQANRGALKNLNMVPSHYSASFLAKPIVSKQPDVLFHFLKNMPTLSH